MAQLIVNDGHVDSLPSTIVVTTNAMLPPSANAGPNQTAVHGKTVLLEGSGTDPQGFSLTYQWSLTNKPAGSLAVLSSTSALKPTFVADLPGTYVVQLIVNDGYVSSPPADRQYHHYEHSAGRQARARSNGARRCRYPTRWQRIRGRGQ